MFSSNSLQDGYMYSISHAFKAIGEKIVHWSPQVSAFDALDLEKPDVIFVTHKNLTRETLLALHEYPDMRIVLYGINLPLKMTEGCPPSLVILPPHTPEHIRQHIEHDNVIHANYAADIVNFTKGYYRDKTKSDILIITDVNTSIDMIALEQINSLLAYPDLSIKCAGYRIPSALYIGSMDAHTLTCFIQSTKMVIVYSLDMLYNCIINRTFCVTPYKQELMPQFLDSDGLIESIEKYLNENKLKNSMTKKAAKQVRKEHTYFHRVMELGEALDIPEWVSKATDTLPRYIT